MERLKHIVEFNILLGAWLIVAPFVMGYSGSTVELANDVALGIVFIACSWWVMAAENARVSAGALQCVGALWLVAAPFFFHYEKLSRAYTNDIVVGVLSLMASATATSMLASRLRRPA